MEHGPVQLIFVRARKSPWIETEWRLMDAEFNAVRARKSPWIETDKQNGTDIMSLSGLVRARGLKPH